MAFFIFTDCQITGTRMLSRLASNPYSMKRILIALLSLSIVSPLLAADTPAKKKTTAAAKAKSEAATDGPSIKSQALAKTLTAGQRTELLGILNKGDDKAVQSLPGLGETRAAAVKKARPFADPIDLLKVDGIGDVTFGEIIAHAKAGFPEATKPAATKPKATVSGAKKKATDSAKKKAAEKVTESATKKK